MSPNSPPPMHTLLEKRQAMSISISSLPEDISEEILLRSPVKSLVRFKSVSKSFCSLINSSNFVNKYINHNIQQNNITLLYPDYPNNMRTTQLISLKSLLLVPSTECHGEVSPEFTDYSCMHSGWKLDSFFGSCEGLLCICYVNFKKDEQIVVLNPSTTEFKEIHVPKKLTDNGEIRSSVFWFGYDYKIADYKLVRVVNIDRNGMERFEVEVYALGFDWWRKIQSVSYNQSVSYRFVKHQPGVLVNGALHWSLVSGVKQEKVLVSFAISSERFVELSLPKERLTYPEEPLEDAKYDKIVGELEGRLCLLFHVFGVRVDLWTMQKYGAGESWTKRFTINGETITKSFYLSLKCSFSNNKILLQCDDKLILYDSKNGSYRKLAVLKIDTCTDAVKYVTSHVSLNSGRYLKQRLE